MKPTFLVFAQRKDAMLSIEALAQHARRFFHTEITQTEDDDLEIAGQRRAIRARDAGEADYQLADHLERVGAHAGGLSLLARRCTLVWEIECEGSRDTVSLLISAMLASLDLGPIVSPERDQIFGVKTARRYLEEWAAPPG